MKKVSVLFSLLFAISLFSTSNAVAEWIDLGGPDGVNVIVLASTPDRIALEITVGGFERTDVEIDGQVWSRIGLPGEAIHLEKGQPELPLVARSVIIPDDRLMVSSVTASEYVDLSDYSVIPSKGNLPRTVNPDDVPFEFGNFYSAGDWFPSETADARGAYILRDFRGETVMVNPIQYQNSTHTLRVFTRLVVELRDSGPGGDNVLVRHEPLAVSQDFLEIYQEHFLNYSSSRYSEVGEIGSMLVIAYDSFAPAMQPFVDWKNQMGLPTTMVLKSQIGASAALIDAYIQNYYDNSSAPKLAFVLLVGDAVQIPSPFAAGGTSDPSYSKVVGVDNYPDIFVGRFSAETEAQLQTQITRTLNYETDPLLVGGDWYPQGVGIGSEFGPGDDGEMDWEHIDGIRTELLNYGYTRVDQIYGPNGSASMVTNSVNGGRTIINYCGHGSNNSWGTTGFSNSHVNALVNDHKLPFIFSVACVNGEFSGYTCFAEAWMRATHNGNPTGAIGFYGASINQSWNPPMCAQDEANRLITADACRTYAALCYNGSCQMMDEYGGGGVEMFLTWHVFGDPSLRVRTKTPTELVVSHPPTLDPEALTFELDVPGVAGALCGLSYQGQYLGSTFADAGGHAVIPISAPVVEGTNLDLTVSAYNAVPYFGAVAVEFAIVPLLVLDPTSFDVTIPRNTVQVEILHLSNAGPEGTTLNFSIDVETLVPGRGLSASPLNGAVGAGEMIDVEVTIDSRGLADGDYSGALVISYNPSQTASVPVIVHVSSPAAIGDGQVPLQVALDAASPNPFQTSTALRFALPSEQAARLLVHDASGRAVRLLAAGSQPAGVHELVWDGKDDRGVALPGGLYFARLETSDRTLTSRILRIR